MWRKLPSWFKTITDHLSDAWETQMNNVGHHLFLKGMFVCMRLEMEKNKISGQIERTIARKGLKVKTQNDKKQH